MLIVARGKSPRFNDTIYESELLLITVATIAAQSSIVYATASKLHQRHAASLI
jgi:hypothetical protein